MDRNDRAPGKGPPMLPLGALNLRELEELARQKLSEMAYGYYASGALEGRTLRANEEAWARLALHHRVLVDVSSRDLSTTVLGTPVSMPVLVAPTAFHALACPEGELATVRAAVGAGTVMCLSSLSNTALEEVCAAATSSAPGSVWFQLYVYRDRAATAALVARAEAAGAGAIVLTVDAPVLGRRERDVRSEFHLPEGLRIENMSALEGHGEVTLRTASSGLAAYFAEKLDPSLTWKDVEWLRSLTRLPVVVKGIVRPDDAERAVDHGASGIVVSNHGGRQLDGSPATATVLGPIADAVQDRIEILVDGGVRRGTDVLRALALGARAVLVGRPILWGLATAGEAGARAVLETFREELDQAMALSGCPNPTLSRELIPRTRPRTGR
jgi:4-hydroxymandelate oxidase